MYGTIGMMRAREGKGDDLVESFRRQLQGYYGVSGAIGLLLYRLDRDPSDFIMVPIFDSRESYFANAGSPAQQEMTDELAPLLEAEPEWHDGEIVGTGMAPGISFASAAYGTVAFARLKKPPGAELDEVSRRQTMEEQEIPGYLFEYLFQLSSDPRAIVFMAAFSSREAYVANAQAPEQDRRYRDQRALLEDDPAWHDGEIIPFLRF